MIYEIFPERFAIGKPNDIQTKLTQPAYQRDGYTRHAKWDERPIGGSDFFGGDLRGVIDHIDYLQDLGTEAVYLTPIFTAYSNHKYDTVDYQSVDPMFGDERVLEELIDALHQRRMRLIMDAVLNHVGTEHPWFLAAERDERPYRDFFTFLADGKYLCWWGYDSLPELRLEHPFLSRLLYRDPDSLLQRWLARGLDQWRFDAALDLGLGTVADICGALAERFPRASLIGEVLSFGSEFCFGPKYFDGVMNYWFRYATLGWLQGTVSTRAYIRALSDYYERYGHEAALRSWNAYRLIPGPLLPAHGSAVLRVLATLHAVLLAVIYKRFTVVVIDRHVCPSLLNFAARLHRAEAVEYGRIRTSRRPTSSGCYC